MLTLTLGTKGELIIPKKIRQSIGMIEQGQVVLELEDHAIRIRVAQEDTAQKWKEQAKKDKISVKKWVYGDALYEELF